MISEVSSTEYCREKNFPPISRAAVTFPKFLPGLSSHKKTFLISETKMHYFSHVMKVRGDISPFKTLLLFFSQFKLFHSLNCSYSKRYLSPSDKQEKDRFFVLRNFDSTFHKKTWIKISVSYGRPRPIHWSPYGSRHRPIFGLWKP